MSFSASASSATDVPQHQLGAESREVLRNGKTDALGTARYDHDLVFDVHGVLLWLSGWLGFYVRLIYTAVGPIVPPGKGGAI